MNWQKIFYGFKYIRYIWDWRQLTGFFIDLAKKKKLAEDYKPTYYSAFYIGFCGIVAAILANNIAPKIWSWYLGVGVFILLLCAGVYYYGGIRPQEERLEKTKGDLAKLRRKFLKTQKWYNELREIFLTQDYLLKSMRRREAELQRALANLDPESPKDKRGQLQREYNSLVKKREDQKKRRDGARKEMMLFDTAVTEVLKEGGWPAIVDETGELRIDEVAKEEHKKEYLELIELKCRFRNTSCATLSSEEKKERIARLSAEEKEAYFKLAGEEERSRFLQLSRVARLPEEEKAKYEQLSEKDQNRFLRLSNKDRQAFSKITQEEEAILLKYFEKEYIEGLTLLNKRQTKQEDNLVKKYYAPFILSFLASAAIFVLFVASKVDLLELEFLTSFNSLYYKDWWVIAKNSSWFGTTSRLLLPVIAVFLIIYLPQCFVKVKVTDRCIRLFLNRPYGEVTHGWRFVPKFLGSLLPFPITVQYFNIEKDRVMLKGDESQAFEVDISVPYYFDKLRDIIRRLAMTEKDVIKLLENRDIEDKERKRLVDPHLGKGIIGDKIAASVRAYVAGRLDTLDEALMMRENLAEELSIILKDDLGDLGLMFGRVVVTGVDPESNMISERNSRAIAQVKVQTEGHKAKAVIREADGKASAIVKTGNAEAEVKKQIGKAEAAVELAMMKANVDAVDYLKRKGIAPEVVISLIAAAVVGQKTWTDVFQAMQGMNVNLYAIPKLEEIINSVTSKLGLSHS